MKISLSQPGTVISAAGHAALLVATLVVFSDTPKFREAQESVPVEIITDAQLNEIMRGEKTAPEVRPTPPRADRIDERTETKPTPVVREAKVDTAAPVQEGRREPDPGRDEKPVAAPPRQASPTPPKPEPVKEPPRPEPPKAPEKAEAKKPDPKEAEAIEQAKAQKLKEETKKTVEAPVPPRIPPRPRETQPEPPRPDQVAKLLEQKKTEERAQKPKTGDEQAIKARTDPTEIARLLSREQAQQRAATGQQLSQQASLGTQTANAARMSPSLAAQLDGLMQEQYKQCWSYFGTSTGHRYIPQIKVEYSKDGALVGQPSLMNPPSDPALNSLAESAVRAVRRCNPLKIPAQFQPYFEQWRARILRFDPEDMQG